jgi:hypothetical protein
VQPVFPNIIRVKNMKVRKLLTCPQFSDSLQVHCAREFVYAESALSSSSSRPWFSGSSLPYTYANNDVSLFCLVADRSSPVKSSRVFNAMDGRFPSPFDCQLTQVPIQIGFLSTIPVFAKVLVHAHCLFRPQPDLLKLKLRTNGCSLSASRTVKAALLFK